MIKLSIIILTHNQKDLTLSCLNSIYNIIENDQAEIILVDNGSKDCTSDEVKKLYPLVKIIKNDSNIGVAAGRNIGLKNAEGEKLMILDNDTIASTEAITELYQYLKQHPECGIVAPSLYSPEGDLQQSFKSFPSLFEKIKNWISGKGKNEIANRSLENPIEPFYVIGAAQMFDSSLFKKIGGLDENIFFGPEDADFCMAVRKEGKRIIYLPSVRIIHNWQRSTTRKLNKTTFLHIKGLFYFYLKHKRFW